MPDWYCSSAAHAAVPVFAISTAYTVGQFVRRITSTPKAQWVMRCTVAGTSAASEPTWPTTNNGTVVSGGATFANVSGQSTYGWSAAAGDIPTLQGWVGANRTVAGDRLFVSSDHTETHAAGSSYGSGSGATVNANLLQLLSVNRTGSVPPVGADLLAGATVNVAGASSQIDFLASCPIYYYGISFIYTGSWIVGVNFNNPGNKASVFDTCLLHLNTASAPRMQGVSSGTLTTLVFSSFPPSAGYGSCTRVLSLLLLGKQDTLSLRGNAAAREAGNTPLDQVEPVQPYIRVRGHQGSISFIAKPHFGSLRSNTRAGRRAG